MATPTSQARRAFLSKLLAGGAAAGVLLLYRKPVWAGLEGGAQGQQGETGPEHDYAFMVDVDRCIGCGLCVQACNVENDVPPGQYRTWVERYVVTRDGVHVDCPDGGMNGFADIDESLRGEVLKSFFVPKLCNHCAQAPCIQVCPVGATFRNPEGFVLVDPEHCIGCSYCVQACPYGSRFINSRQRIADKCTWCYHRVSQGGLPACVTVCPTQARLFGDLKDAESAVAKMFYGGGWDVLKPEMETASMCIYKGLQREVV